MHLRVVVEYSFDRIGLDANAMSLLESSIILDAMSTSIRQRLLTAATTVAIERQEKAEHER